MQGLFNFFIAQWFGFRLAKIIDEETGTLLGWTWVKVLPLTGWDNPFFENPFIFWD